MPSLADSSEVIGFFSYSREDDEDSRGALSTLRERIQRELRGQLGRSAREFRLWQDKEAIAPGQLWETEIRNAVQQSIFFIPIITPTAVRSSYCQFEFEAFLNRELSLNRTDLVFPLLYIRVPALEDGARRENDPLLSIISRRQYVDWRHLRHLDPYSTAVGEAVERFCAKIAEALLRNAASTLMGASTAEGVRGRALDNSTEKEPPAKPAPSAKKMTVISRSARSTRSGLGRLPRSAVIGDMSAPEKSGVRNAKSSRSEQQMGTDPINDGKKLDKIIDTLKNGYLTQRTLTQNKINEIQNLLSTHSIYLTLEEKRYKLQFMSLISYAYSDRELGEITEWLVRTSADRKGG